MPKFDPVNVHGSRIENLYLPSVDPKGGENGLTNFHPKEQDNSDRARQGSSERICGSHGENSPVVFFFGSFGKEGTSPLIPGDSGAISVRTCEMYIVFVCISI